MRCFPILNDAIFGRCFQKNIDVDVFDDVLKNTKHRENDASNDVNRPPLALARLLALAAGPRWRGWRRAAPGLPEDEEGEYKRCEGGGAPARAVAGGPSCSFRLASTRPSLVEVVKDA